ncbi:hypothetical protein [Modestobacter versicolor]|uniref:Htaa domain-containing protein n=1 Tax=Modestobacter versicolor TaxID=429133 RepID=A0A323VQ87_9ACTN|nr:hypothetical protein [Modestobacter versicolor]MBB3676028.1 hypothetical protein [Modestobacter versicolor]PZA21498.1 hypothetical protein DMO24_09985 [Modestobacter versicolor]
MISKSATRKSFVAAAALSAVVGLSACSSNDTDTAQAADNSSSSASYGRPAPAASVPAIPGGTTAVALDAGFTDALTSLGLTPGVIGGATLDGATGTVTFPITGGEVTLYDRESGYRPWVQGTIFHEGSGLSLTAGATTVELTDFTIDPGKPARLFGNVSVNGQLAVASAPLFNLDGSTLSAPSMDADGSAVLDGTTVKLSAEAAELLNTTFGTDALAGEFVIGAATITVETS